MRRGRPVDSSPPPSSPASLAPVHLSHLLDAGALLRAPGEDQSQGSNPGPHLRDAAYAETTAASGAGWNALGNAFSR
jgi:hypothetical protein